MPSSKTDTAVRFPESADQQRRIRNVTQDQKAISRSRDEASSGKEKAKESTTWSPNQLLGSHMDAAGQPVPDPATTGDGAKVKKAKGGSDDDADVFEAMTADFD
ncbi:hypothetical protein N7492_010533 [Penicillium capsulatum]|uniref:Uncharacterized protein n=1 Tax=Penicillium capsulatum TaxID=69766 RepID=A0A9W9HLD0_9EURO|nr:hypothetical protein N7492_010533 [Penicillium capsulatum]KAJ6113035.1 hypothetical protein N7512_008359 [Penicillium capsulatum]